MELDYFSISFLIFRNNLSGYRQGAQDSFYQKHFFFSFSIIENWTVLEKITKLVEFTVGKKKSIIRCFFGPKTTNFVERKNSFKNFEFAIRNFSPVQGSTSFCGGKLYHFSIKKVPSNMVKETFWKIFKNNSHILRKKSYEITEKAFFF
jgi:hypothetical protein